MVLVNGLCIECIMTVDTDNNSHDEIVVDVNLLATETFETLHRTVTRFLLVDMLGEGTHLVFNLLTYITQRGTVRLSHNKGFEKDHTTTTDKSLRRHIDHSGLILSCRNTARQIVAQSRGFILILHHKETVFDAKTELEMPQQLLGYTGQIGLRNDDHFGVAQRVEGAQFSYMLCDDRADQ